MCGIAGFFDRQGRTNADVMGRIALAMGDSLLHRGPDDGGIYTDAPSGIAFAQRRLSVVDLSPMGHQPMISRSGRFIINYNGEVYNFAELRSELEALGKSFRGHSDTEVILESCEQYGIAATVKRLIGMFAIALWDRESRTMWLARDRLGIKPVYWGIFGDLVLFGSELKALLVHPGWTPEIDREALTAYMRHNYIPAPRSIYCGVRKLRQGHILTIAPGEAPREEAFWSLEDVVAGGKRNPLTDISDTEATDQLETLLRDAVGRRMIADVPLGAFLSGGVDSSVVVALMQAQSARPIKTFSIGFNEAGFNEAEYAKEVARHLGTDHTELYVEPRHAIDAIADLPRWFDEPFADSSQIPTFLVSQMTRKHVTVALSGDGGDELFAGYMRYHLAQTLWRNISRLPLPLRSAAAGALRSVSPENWDNLFQLLPPLRNMQAGDRIWKLAAVLEQNGDQIYKRLISHWEDPAAVVIGGREPSSLLDDPAVTTLVPDFLERMQYLDTATYLPDDILVKVDRASMAVALEARVPLIDHRVVEFSWRLPQRFKIRNGQSKWLLRQVLYRHVPPHLIERPKMGFGVPIDRWLRGPLRDWAESLLAPDRLRRDGLFDAAAVQTKWTEHLSGRRNWQYLLWDVLMAQAWLEHHQRRHLPIAA
jgi:asparagine synthase (glutamine-hydrolysing)